MHYYARRTQESQRPSGKREKNVRKAATGRLFRLSKNLVENEIYAAGRRGRRTVNVLPFPGALSTLTVPPWRRAICCTM